MGSEMCIRDRIKLNEKKILSKGRLGPGEIIGVRIDKGKVFSNDQIKDFLAKEYKDFNSQIIFEQLLHMLYEFKINNLQGNVFS